MSKTPVPPGNIDTIGVVHPDEDFIPVPCKCCQKLHPECGCWNIANSERLVGHDCLEQMKWGDIGGLVWNPKHPSQQRTAIYFHLHQLKGDVVDLLLNQAAVATLNVMFRTPDHERALDKAKIAIERLQLGITESMAFLDQHDPTRRVH